MARIIRITENDLVKIVKRVIKEQPGLFDVASDPALAGVIFTPGIEKGGCKKENPAKNKLSQLLTYCGKIQPDSNTTKIKAWNDRLYKSMKGRGTNEDFIKVLDEIKTVNELSAIWKTFKYDNQNLWRWMEGEMKYNWDDTWNRLKKFQTIAKIPTCLEYNKNTTTNS